MQGEDRALALLVGGDDALRAMLTFLLTNCGWRVASDDADDAATRSPRLSWPAVALLVVVDDGTATHDVSTLDAPRRRAGAAPVLLLTRRPDREARRRAALAGVARVIALPAHPRDLRAQFQSLLPASTPSPATGDGAPAPLIHAGGVVLDTSARALHCERAGREPVRLTRHEATVLAALMRRPGVVYPRQALLDQIWGTHYVGDGASLDVLMSRIRRKLAGEGVGRYVQTRRGQGYCFDARALPRPAPADRTVG